MERNSILIGAVLLAVGVGIGYTIPDRGYGARGGHMMSNGSSMEQNIDQHFIAQMIPHHEGAIVMAKIALERSKRPEIISLANSIIEAQQREIAEMNSWYRSWFGSTPSDFGMGGMHMDGMTGDTGNLAQMSDTQFDKEFIEQMIPHHEMAIMMAQMLAASTERPEMAQLAENIIRSQSGEIELMRNWRTDWYDDK